MTDAVTVARKPCAGCRRILLIEDFPLATPRFDGSRHPMRFCDECLALRCRPGVLSEAEKLAVKNVTKRESRFRRRLQTGHW